MAVTENITSVGAILKANDCDTFFFPSGGLFFFNISYYNWHDYEMRNITYVIATIPILSLSLCCTCSSDSYHLAVCSFHIHSITAWRNRPLQCCQPTERCLPCCPFTPLGVLQPQLDRSPEWLSQGLWRSPHRDQACQT